MAWWRRDPSLFCRSPAHRYAQRVLRDNEAALRTRYFSRTPSKSAQHEDNGNRKRPSNMSDFEWIQLQHYERWRKRLEDDPYKTLFGASNNMLGGKGLLDWEWIHKTFPKWMLNDMGMEDKSQQKAQEETKYPKKVEIRDEASAFLPKAREPLFPEPSIRRTTFERDASAGIMSPSDLRRPRESSHVKVVGSQSKTTPSNGASNIESEALFANEPSSPAFPGTPSVPEPSHDPMVSTQKRAAASQSGGEESIMSAAAQKESTAASEKPMSALRDSYMKASDSEDVFAIQRAAMETYSAELKRIHPMLRNDKYSEGKDWRQTTLERRAASKLVAKPQDQTLVLSKLADEKAAAEHALPASPPETLDVPTEHLPQEIKHENKIPSVPQEDAATQDHATQPRSSSDILKQLPQDDIDFLSASDIRASMGAKRSRQPTDKQKQAERQSLEDAFAAIPDTPNVDSMLEAQIINNQHVRRKAREMWATQNAEASKVQDSLKEKESTSPAADVPVESSMDRMKKWLETTGASFAKQFWQDPTEEADVTKTKLFFDKVANYLKKGQAATRHITGDLEKDIPASIPLLKRLKQDEQLLDSAIHRLRQRSPSGSSQGLSPRKIRAMESLKTRFHQTNNELEKAYEALRVFAGTEAATHATGSFKRRLTAASKVLHKNAQLLRMLIWSLQTRLEDPEIDRSILSNYKVVADNLLSLRDTQMTLLRLVERAMLVYGVVPNAAENLDAIKAEQSAEYDNCDDPFVRARLAADAHLIKEIRAHRSVKEVSTNSIPASEPKPVIWTTLDEPSPLAHSLFRPFGPAIEKLGSKEVQKQIKEDERRRLSDATLVEEVKQAYEDTYGKITANHEQVKKPTMEHEMSEHDVAKPIQLLKDDPEAIAIKSEETGPLAAPELSTTVATDHIADSPEVVDEARKQYTISGVTAASLKNDEAISTTTSAESTSEPEAPSTVAPAQTIETLPTHYTILVRDPQTDALSITTSKTGPPRDTSPAVPLHQALSALDSPAKFIPYITQGLEVVSANKDILVLRDALDDTAATRPFETIRTASSSANEQPDFSRDTVNPIDGTTRLSPTGYVGPEESAEQLEKEFQDRRQAAGKMHGKESTQQEQPRDEGKKGRKRGAGGVVKTAIWVAGMCYVAGVIGEIATGGV